MANVPLHYIALHYASSQHCTLYNITILHLCTALLDQITELHYCTTLLHYIKIQYITIQ